MKTPKSPTEKPTAKAKAEKPATKTVKAPKAEKASPAPKAPKPAKPSVPKATTEAAPELAVVERVGLTAGSIWSYLSQNGGTSVTKLVKELPEEERIIQRSLGWLAQENKIALYFEKHVEIVALK